MPISYLSFREVLYPQGLFSFSQVKLHFPEFNPNNLLHWQKKGYIIRLRRDWYCFSDCISIPEFSFIIANTIYGPSYISHQEALMFYGLIPEHIVDSTSVTTKKTKRFDVQGKRFNYYSIHTRLYFGFELREMTLNGFMRNFLLADREKAILDLLYIFHFYKTEEDIKEIRFNEIALSQDIDWVKMEHYLRRFGLISLEKKVQIIRKIYQL